MTASVIKSASFNAVIQTGNVAPIAELLTLNIPLLFDEAANINIYNGVFTPADDYVYIFQNLPHALAPNFLIYLADAPFNACRVMSGGQNFLNSINRFKFVSLNPDSANFVSSLYIDGRTTATSPMAQGTPVSWTVIAGQANVS